jgi:hypothetical protein
MWDGNGSKQRTFEFFGNIPLRATFSQDAQRVIATDFAGRVAVWNVSDGKRAGELDANPLPLADQLAAARKRAADVETRHSSGTNSVADIELSEARDAVHRLAAAQLLSAVCRAREHLAQNKHEHDRLTAALEANTQALQQAQKELAAARAAAAKAEAQIKSAQAEAVRTDPANRRSSTNSSNNTAPSLLLLPNSRSAPSKLRQLPRATENLAKSRLADPPFSLPSFDATTITIPL